MGRRGPGPGCVGLIISRGSWALGPPAGAHVGAGGAVFFSACLWALPKAAGELFHCRRLVHCILSSVPL